MIPVGVWIDCPPARVCSERYFDDLADHNISTAALMISRSTPHWQPTWARQQIETACALARDHDIEIVLTTWMAPNVAMIRATVDAMSELLPLGASAWEVDLEHLWLRDRVVGYESLFDAGQHLLDEMRSLCEASDCRVEVTSHGGHAETGSSAIVAPGADRLYLQCYSVRHRSGRVIEWTDLEGPSRLQRRAITRAHGVPALDTVDGPRLCVGLPAWDQRWPGHTEHEALQLALDTALEYAPLDIRLWSSKWIFGAKRQEWIRRFLKALSV